LADFQGQVDYATFRDCTAAEAAGIYVGLLRNIGSHKSLDREPSDGIEPRSAALVDQRLTTFIGFAT
jgi:hypothetical protein